VGDYSSGQTEPAPFLLNRPLTLNLTLNPGQPQFVPATYGSQVIQDAIALGALEGGTGPVYTQAITGPIGQINLGGFSPVGVDPYHFPQRRADETLQAADTFSAIRGRHIVTAGGEFWYVRLNSDLKRTTA
jgi:hypothetical protein